jgi:hypothetical protein
MIVLALSLTQLFGQSAADVKSDSNAIKATGLDYGDGFYSGAAERMERALHPDLNKVVLVKLPQTGKTALQYSTFSGLIELTRAKVGYLEEGKRKAEVSVLVEKEDVASAKLNSAMYNDFLQMVKIDGQWKIVNVLWTWGPDAPNRPKMESFSPDSESEAIRATSLDLFESIYSGDAAGVGKAVHPEVSVAQLTKLPQTGKLMISRLGSSIVIEATRARMQMLPENRRNIQVRILDVMDGLAFVEVTTSVSDNYIQMAKFYGQWKIINVLSKASLNTSKQDRK